MKLKIDKFNTKAAALSYIRDELGCDAKAAEKYLMEKLPKESYYQKKIMEFLKKNYPDAFIWKAAAGVYSVGGIPDICAVIGGRYFGFEVKRPYIGVLSEIQKNTIERINAAGGCAGVVIFPEDAKKMIEEG